MLPLVGVNIKNDVSKDTDKKIPFFIVVLLFVVLFYFELLAQYQVFNPVLIHNATQWSMMMDFFSPSIFQQKISSEKQKVQIILIHTIG